MTAPTRTPEPSRRRIVLGVTGGIAAYKAVGLLRLLTEAGHHVTVVPTPAALRFVGEPTWAAISGAPVHTGVFDGAAEVEHVALGRIAELVVVAPATADLLARAAAGRADDLLTATLLTARCPIVLAPAMHTEMWDHPATRENIATLRRRGVTVLDPAVGRLTGADSGAGRLPEPAAIFASLGGHLALAERSGSDLAGRTVLVSAGGTREPLDPVRYLANRSSGRQGFAVAAAAAARGARVVVVAANPTASPPAGVDLTLVETTEQLAEAMWARAADADAVVMAAAPADFTPKHPSSTKIKKRRPGRRDRSLTTRSSTRPTHTLELAETTDVLAGLVERRHDGQVVVGFAAETGDEDGSPLEYGRAKLEAKGADLLFVNVVGGGRGFGAVRNSGTLVGADGSAVEVPVGSSKDTVAHTLLDAVAARLR